MTTPAINETASLALSAARRAADTSKDVSKNPSWTAPAKQSGGSARMLIEKGLSTFSNHGALPSTVRDYATRMHERTAPALPGSNSPISEAAHRVAALIPLVIASELNKIANHLTDKMTTASGSAPATENQGMVMDRSAAQGIDRQKMRAIQAAAAQGSEASNWNFT